MLIDMERYFVDSLPLTFLEKFSGVLRCRVWAEARHYPPAPRCLFLYQAETDIVERDRMWDRVYTNSFEGVFFFPAVPSQAISFAAPRVL